MLKQVLKNMEMPKTDNALSDIKIQKQQTPDLFMPIYKEPIFSMSLLSGWKDIYEDIKAGKSGKEQILHELTIDSLDIKPIDKIDPEEFRQAAAASKVLMILGLMKEKILKTKEDSLSREFYEKIKNMPLTFWTSNLMLDLAETDEKGAVILNDKALMNWMVAFFEKTHELIHITGMDKIEAKSDESREDSAIKREINNYLYLMSMLKEMFPEGSLEKPEEFIDALRKTGLFKKYDMKQMKKILKEKFDKMPESLAVELELLEGKENLSYPDILMEMFNKIANQWSKHRNKKDLIASVFNSITEKNEGNLDSKIKSFMAVNFFV